METSSAALRTVPWYFSTTCLGVIVGLVLESNPLAPLAVRIAAAGCHSKGLDQGTQGNYYHADFIR